MFVIVFVIPLCCEKNITFKFFSFYKCFSFDDTPRRNSQNEPLFVF